MIPTYKFIDAIRPTPQIAELMMVYDEMSDEQQKHACKICAQLWARVDHLSPAGAFELTMKVLLWAERNEQ